MKPNTGILRKNYLSRVLRLLDNDNALLVLGLRRTGKTCISMQLKEQLSRRLGEGGAVFRWNFETPRSVHMTADHLIERFGDIYDPGKKNVFLLDEITHVSGWERAVNHAFSYPNVKLVFFSSTRRLLSSDFEAYSSGRFDIIDALPLSMEEFAEFRGIRELTPPDTPASRRRFISPAGEELTPGGILERYLRDYALPGIMSDYRDEHGTDPVSDSVSSAIILHDILEVGSYMGLGAVADPALLRGVISVMASSMGRNVSATWIGKQIPAYISRHSSTRTVESYMHALLNAHLFYAVPRYDIKAERELKTLYKYYMTDMRLMDNFMLAYPESEALLIEDRVFFELIRRGYTVFNGKLPQGEIKFMAENGSERVYVQIADVFGERERRELLPPLRRIRDGNPKVIICSGSETRSTADGIMIINAADFLLGASWKKRQTQ